MKGEILFRLSEDAIKNKEGKYIIYVDGELKSINNRTFGCAIDLREKASIHDIARAINRFSGTENIISMHLDLK